VKKSADDGIIWTKEVEDYQRFGVVVTDKHGHMTKIVEKPSTPISRRANIGLQYVKDWKTLFDGIAHVLKSPPGKGGEFYLTDAFQYMVDQGKKLRVAEVGGWYDCGKVDTLLETNDHLLRHGRSKRPRQVPDGVKIIDPVYIEDSVTLQDVEIGPNVAIEADSTIVGSEIKHSILGRGVRVDRSLVHGSLIGDMQVIKEQDLTNVVMDEGEAAPAR
jgi:glucose-1-phosphate thymidylyltransferase